MKRRILVIDDERQLRMVLRDNLEHEGYEVLCADTGERGLEIVSSKCPDLLLLDVMLPRRCGYDVCRQIRAGGFQLPIIMLTVRNAERDRIAGLDSGADDYLCKPFQLGELLARIRAQLRRNEHAYRASGSGVVCFGEVTVEALRRAVTKSGRPLHLSAREFDLLDYFIGHQGELVTREQILGEVWRSQDGAQARAVDNFVAKLRKRVDSAGTPSHILTVYGVGYRFVI